MYQVLFRNGLDGWVSRAKVESFQRTESIKRDFETRFPGLIWTIAEDRNIKKVIAADGKISYEIKEVK